MTQKWHHSYTQRLPGEHLRGTLTFILVLILGYTGLQAFLQMDITQQDTESWNCSSWERP